MAGASGSFSLVEKLALVGAFLAVVALGVGTEDDPGIVVEQAAELTSHAAAIQAAPATAPMPLPTPTSTSTSEALPPETPAAVPAAGPAPAANGSDDGADRERPAIDMRTRINS